MYFLDIFFPSFPAPWYNGAKYRFLFCRLFRQFFFLQLRFDLRQSLDIKIAVGLEEIKN